MCCCPASRPAAAAATAASGSTASAWAAAVDLRSPGRRAAGRAGPGAVRRHLDLPGARGAQRRAGAVPGRHPPHRLRGGRAQRAGPAGRHRGGGRGRPGRAGGDPGARLYSPAAIVAVDPTAARRDWAEKFGANVATSPEQAQAEVDRLTDDLGADTAIEAVGIPETFEQCTELIRPGGRVANVGVHGRPATLHLESLWIKNVTITTGLVDTFSTATLLKTVAAGRIDPTRFTTHRFALADAMEAYDTFARAGETNALKVLLTADG